MTNVSCCQCSTSPVSRGDHGTEKTSFPFSMVSFASPNQGSEYSPAYFSIASEGLLSASRVDAAFFCSFAYLQHLLLGDLELAGPIFEACSHVFVEDAIHHGWHGEFVVGRSVGEEHQAEIHARDENNFGDHAGDAAGVLDDFLASIVPDSPAECVFIKVFAQQFEALVLRVAMAAEKLRSPHLTRICFREETLSVRQLAVVQLHGNPFRHVVNA